MIDPVALREALAEQQRIQSEQWESYHADVKAELLDEDTLRDWSGILTQHDLINAAAREFLRLMETAETVWWCEEHKALRCCGAHPDICTQEDSAVTDLTGELPECRMVEAVLTRRDIEPQTETEVEKNQIGMW